MRFLTRSFISAFIILALCEPASAQVEKIKSTGVGMGWAGNSVNAVVFRKNSLVTAGKWQFISYYDSSGNVILGKRKQHSRKWIIHNTGLKGNIRDAHNSISIMVDGKGFLHIAWDHHNNALHYRRALKPYSLELEPGTMMVGSNEGRLSYPEFYRMPSGDLLFLYRDGGSGGGNLVINRYDVRAGQWKRVADNLIDGESKRNAYWQAHLDANGVFHISWVWRESPDVASNHDLCYARSRDGGMNWERSDGSSYALPINAANAEYVARIPQGSELINQTSMTSNAAGFPVIAGYWRDAGDAVPQYHVVTRNQAGWLVTNTGFRKTPFSLSGGGTKSIPIARPQVLAWSEGGVEKLAIIFRDRERGNRISIAVRMLNGQWSVNDIGNEVVDEWEPSFDTERWKKDHRLFLFVQRVAQADAEGVSSTPSQMVRVIECRVR